MKEGTTVVNTEEYFKLKEYARKLKKELSDVLHDKTTKLSRHIDNDCQIEYYKNALITDHFYSKSDAVKEFRKVNDELMSSVTELGKELSTEINLVTEKCAMLDGLEVEIKRLKNRNLYQRIFNL